MVVFLPSPLSLPLLACKYHYNSCLYDSLVSIIFVLVSGGRTGVDRVGDRYGSVQYAVLFVDFCIPKLQRCWMVFLATGSVRAASP